MSAIKVLESRKDDKEALEFLRHLEAIRRTWKFYLQIVFL